LRENQGPVALLFGSEKFGLSNQELAFCHHLVHIPTSPQTPSMNLGQAVAVCLYELVREPGGELPLGPKPVEGSDAEQMTRMLLEVLRESGYTNRIVATSIELKVRRFLRRLHLTSRDAPLVLGILRQILWKFRERG
jgi:tRNA/rRNA methyltransferase